jgi:hypothetical protein
LISAPSYGVKTVTITHGPMRMQKRSKKWPLGKKFSVADPWSDDAAEQGGLFTGRFEDLLSSPTGGRVLGKGMVGEVSYGIDNGPTPPPPATQWPPGTEWCVSNFIDWQAKKPGTPGFFPERHPPFS